MVANIFEVMMPEVQSTPQMTQIQNLDEVPQLASSYSVFDDPIREQVCENWQQTIVPSIESDEVQKEYLKTYLDESPPLDVVGNSVPESRICHEPTDHGLTTGESEYLINRAARKHNAARAEKSKELAQAKTFYPHENFTDLHFSSDRLVVDDNDIDSVLESFYGGADPLSKNPEKDTMQQQRTAEESDRAHLGAEKKALKNLARTRGLK